MMHDYNIIYNKLSKIFSHKGLDLDQNQINPYQNKNYAQQHCNHRWEDDTNAIYTTPDGYRMCAICKKVF